MDNITTNLPYVEPTPLTDDDIYNILTNTDEQ